MMRAQILWLTVATAISMTAAQVQASPFVPSAAAVSEPAYAGKILKVSNDGETEYWQQVREADAAEAYNAYLKVFPSGKFAGEARQRLQQLKGGGSAAGAALGGAQESAESLYWRAMGADFASQIDEALSLYQRAADMNHPRAAGMAGLMLWRTNDYAAAFPWLERAAEEHDDRLSMILLGHINRAGLGGRVKDLYSALWWYQKSMERGDVGVQEHIDALKARLGLRR